METHASKIEQYKQKLLVTEHLRDPIIEKVIETLKLPPGSQGLDAGCGIGLQAFKLSEAVGSEGRVTGLDISPEFLDHARGLAEQAGLANQVFFKVGDVKGLPFEDDAFDWVWSSDCVGYGAEEPLPLIRELVRVTKPGGLIALFIYSSQMLLPGYPLLEAQLNATSAGIAPFNRGMKPETHYFRALNWFKKAGLERAAARAFVADFHAPLDPYIRDGLSALIEMRWEGAESEVNPKVWSEFQRLVHPDSPDFILNLPDYYAFFVYSLFFGEVFK